MNSSKLPKAAKPAVSNGNRSRLENVITPWWTRLALPTATWRKDSPGQKKVYMTFDDGPTDSLTEELLATLKQFGAKATFFCIGKHAQKDQRLVTAMVDDGHLIANHSYSHLNGWKTSCRNYVADVIRCQDVLENQLGYPPRFFRPPFGRITPWQFAKLRKRFEIVMWDTLSLDYRPELTGQTVAENVTDSVRPGSIVLMHDSELAAARVKVALPVILRHLTANEFQFCTLDE